MKKKIAAEQKENDLRARLERTKRLRSNYGDDYISIRMREDEAEKEAKLQAQRLEAARSERTTSSSRYSPSYRSSSRTSSKPSRSSSTFASSSMLLSDEFDLQRLLDEQEAEFER